MTPMKETAAAATRSKKAKTPKPVKEPKPKKEKGPKPELVVFAFRLPAADRDLIHKAAGPGKATKFVLSAALTAAKQVRTEK